jgi:hypothetical protein
MQKQYENVRNWNTKNRYWNTKIDAQGSALLLIAKVIFDLHRQESK